MNVIKKPNLYSLFSDKCLVSDFKIEYQFKKFGVREFGPSTSRKGVSVYYRCELYSCLQT